MVRKPKTMPRLTAPTYSKGPDNSTRVKPSDKKRKPRKPKMTQPGKINPKLSKNDPTAFKRPKRRKPRPGTPTLGRTIKRPTPARPMRRRKTR